MLRQIIISVSLLFSMSILIAQQTEKPKMEWTFNTEFDNISVFNIQDVSYQYSLLSGAYKKWSCNFNFRLEDQLTSENTYVLLNDVSFFDVQFSYSLGAIQIGLFIENLLGFNNNQFSIEPNLERRFGVADTVFFTHEANFLIGSSFTYNF